MEKVNYELITLAREIEGRNQKDFAKSLGIEQGTLSKIENGLLDITDEIVQKTADLLDYPIDFFYQNWMPARIEGHYRRKVSEPIKVFKELRAKMTLAERHFNILTQHIELPQANYPKWDVTTDGPVLLCAKHLRDYWRIPKGRINNVTEVLEENGFVIIELDLGEMDGFSALSDLNVPLIFINKKLSGDRYRLTVVHEAFHFIIHHGQKVSPERKIESEAFEGASEFLMPIEEIGRQISHLNLPKLADLKAYWKVSMQAILYKAKKSETITQHQYEYLLKQLTVAGYRKQEPIEITKEQPTIFKDILAIHLDEYKYSIDELGKLLHFNKINDWYLNKHRLKLLKSIA